jgi:hypothetical protein
MAEIGGGNVTVSAEVTEHGPPMGMHPFPTARTEAM